MFDCRFSHLPLFGRRIFPPFLVEVERRKHSEQTTHYGVSYGRDEEDPYTCEQSWGSDSDYEQVTSPRVSKGRIADLRDVYALCDRFAPVPS